MEDVVQPCDAGAGALSVDHGAAACVQADVVQWGVGAGEEEQVPGHQVVSGDRGSLVELGAGVVSQAHRAGGAWYLQ